MQSRHLRHVDFELMHEETTILAVNKRCWLHPNSGGAEKNLKELLSHSSDGAEIFLLCGKYPNAKSTETAQGVTIRRVGLSTNPDSLIDVIIAYFFVTIYFHWYVRDVNPDVVLTVFSPLPWILSSPAPRIVQHHHISVESFRETHEFPFNYLGSYAQRVGIHLSKSGPVLSVSQSTTDSLVSHGVPREKIRTIRNGINITDYSVGREDEDPTILFLGAFKSYKGADRVPEIHQRLQEISENPVYLDIAGPSGPEQSLLREYCDRYDYATLHGFVSNDKKVELLQKAWVVIAPSRIEGYGIVVIEANACGTPVVGTEVPGLRDSIKHEETGLLAPEDPLEISRQIHKLLSDDDLRTEFGLNCRRWAEEHSWEQSAHEFQMLCREVAVE